MTTPSSEPRAGKCKKITAFRIEVFLLLAIAIGGLSYAYFRSKSGIGQGVFSFKESILLSNNDEEVFYYLPAGIYRIIYSDKEWPGEPLTQHFPRTEVIINSHLFATFHEPNIEFELTKQSGVTVKIHRDESFNGNLYLIFDFLQIAPRYGDSIDIVFDAILPTYTRESE